MATAARTRAPRARVHPAVISLGGPLLLGASALVLQWRGMTFERDLAACGLAFWLAFLLNTLVHEGAHFIVARSLGMRPDRFVVGPLDLHRTPRGRRVRACPLWMSVLGGMVGLRDPQAREPRAQLAVAAAGPLASGLLVPVLLVVLPFRLPTSLDELEAFCRFGSFFSGVAVLGAAVTAVSNALPLRNIGAGAGLPSDGWVVRQAWRRLRAERRDATAPDA